MADRVLRGSRLGAVSYETDRDHDLAPRRMAKYKCENGEIFDIPFADEAEIPGTWLCRNGLEGTLMEGLLPKPRRSSLPAPTGTCCSSVARSRNSKSSSKSVSIAEGQASRRMN